VPSLYTAVKAFVKTREFGGSYVSYTWHWQNCLFKGLSIRCDTKEEFNVDSKAE